MYVKICGVNDESAISAAAGAGADAVGLVMTASPREVGDRTAARLARHARSLGLDVVAVFGVLDPHSVHRAVACAATHVQGQLPPEGLELPAGLGLFPTVPATGGADLVAQIVAAATVTSGLVVVDSPQPGSGQPLDWASLAGLDAPILLTGGLRPDNVAAAIALVAPRGVDVSSGVEGAQGVKDPVRIAAFVAAARSGSPPGPAPRT